MYFARSMDNPSLSNCKNIKMNNDRMKGWRA